MSCSDLDDREESKRQSRNSNEKKRRDQFNVLINELARMLGSGSRKMDKSAVLRSAISYLRSYNETSARSRGDEHRDEWKPAFLSDDEFTQLMLDGLDSFVLAFNGVGKVLHVSENVISLLNLLPEEVLYQSLYELLPAEQNTLLYDFLSRQPAGRFALSLQLRRGEAVSASPASSSASCRPRYEPVHMTGCVQHPPAVSTSASGCALAAEAGGGPVYIAVCRLQACQLVREVVPTPNWRREFTSRHSLEWKFLFLDHRASHLIGYSAMEVLGTSVYDYYHCDDLHVVAGCHEQLMRVGQGISCYYRFLTKGQQWLWLQTKYYITYHQWNSKPEFIVCTHSVVSYAEVRRHRDACRARCATPTSTPPLLRDTDPLWSPMAAPPPPAASPCTTLESTSPASLYMSTGEPSTPATSVGHSQSDDSPSPLAVKPEPLPPPPPAPAAPQQAQKRARPLEQPQQPQQPEEAAMQLLNEQLAISPQQQVQDSLLRKHQQLQQRISQQQQELAQINDLLLANCQLLVPPAAAGVAPPPAPAPCYAVDFSVVAPPDGHGALTDAPAAAVALAGCSSSQLPRLVASSLQPTAAAPMLLQLPGPQQRPRPPGPPQR